MAVAFIIILYILNIISWIFIFARFKNIFSTDGVVEKVKVKLNNLLIQIDSATDRNIKLINERIKELKFISAEADNKINILQDKISQVKKIELINSEISKNERARNFEDKVYYENNKIQGSKFSPVSMYQKEQMSYTAPENIILETESGESESNNVDVREEIENVPEIRISEDYIRPKKELREIVMELNGKGYSIEEIASETGKSTQEVKIILEFS